MLNALGPSCLWQCFFCIRTFKLFPSCKGAAGDLLHQTVPKYSCEGFARIYWFVRNCLMHVTDLSSGYNWIYLTSSSFLSSPSPPPSLSPLVAPPFPAVSIDPASTAEASEDTGQGSITPPIVKYKFQDYIFTRILVRILPPWISRPKETLRCPVFPCGVQQHSGLHLLLLLLLLLHHLLHLPVGPSARTRGKTLRSASFLHLFRISSTQHLTSCVINSQFHSRFAQPPDNATLGLISKRPYGTTTISCQQLLTTFSPKSLFLRVMECLTPSQE